jgi:hypothetical protein
MGHRAVKESAAERLLRSEVAELLARYKGLRLLPSVAMATRIVGTLTFRAEGRTTESIEDSYELRIEVPDDFPEHMALAWETGGRIPATYHKLDNGALCLGSRVRLRLQMDGSRSVLRFVERCVIPYLYGYSHFLKTGKMPFGELDHGEIGSLQDLASLIGMEMGPAIPYCVLATMKLRRANKQRCPCGSGRRLGRCHNRKVNMLRDRVGRLVLVKEMQTIAAAFREASLRKRPAPPTPDRAEAHALRDNTIEQVADAPMLAPWAMRRHRAPAPQPA